MARVRCGWPGGSVHTGSMAFLRRHWPVLLVILFPLIPLWRAVFLGEAVGPFDQIRQMAPWNGPAPDRPFDVLQADAVLQFYPWRDMVFEAWGKGQLPLWNPYQLAGTPLLANSQSAGFYPPHIVMGVLHVPTHWAITLLAWFHLALAGLGVMALARRLGATREGGAVGGVLFSGSAFMLAWTALPSVISTCAWIPWVLAGVYGLFERLRTSDGETGDGSSPRVSPLQYFKMASGVAFATAMMLLAGHLQFAFYGLLAAGFVWLCLTLSTLFDKTDTSYRSHKSYSIAFPLLSLALGAGMAAPQLLPVMEYSQFSHRRNVPSDEGYKAYVAGAIAPFELAGLVYPTAVGLPYAFAPENKPLSQYWPALVKQGANFAEGAIGIGPLALFGLLLFPWRTHAKRLWVPMALLAGFAFLMALGTILNKPFYFLIPGWSSTGSPGRIGVLFVIGACALSGIAWGQGVLARETKTWRDLGPALSLIVVTSLTILFTGLYVSSASPRFAGLGEELMRRLATEGVGLVAWSLIVAIVTTGALIIPARPRYPSIGGLFALLLAGLYWGRYAPHVISTAAPLSETDANSALKSPAGSRTATINDPWELVVAAPATLPPNTAALLRIPDLAGYDSLLHKDTHLFLGYVNGQDPAPPANGNIQYIKPFADPAKLAEAGVTQVISRRPVFEGLTPESLNNGLLRYTIPGPGRAYVQNGTATAPTKLEDGYDRQTVTASGPGTLIVKDRLMPGWTAFVDGKETPWSENSPTWKASDGRDVKLWRAVDLPEGEHRVEFRYAPPGLQKGIWIFLPCALLTLAAAVVGFRRNDA